MPYIGRTPVYGHFYYQSITPDGITTQFALNYNAPTAASMMVSVGGVLQEPNQAYTISSAGDFIIFSEAPPSGATVFVTFMGERYSVATIDDSGVTAGTYGNVSYFPSFTVNRQGRITAVSNSSVAAGFTAQIPPGTSGNVLISDGTNWKSAVVTTTPALNIISTVTVTAVKDNHYVLTNAANSIITLPASPTAGDLLWISVGNRLATNLIGRNSSNIQGLAEDMTLDSLNASVQMRYINTRLGWIVV